MGFRNPSRRAGNATSPRGRFRIIGGAWRGRKFPVPDEPGVRPTPDRVRETVFNWLAPVIEGARCLDLYAGSGALGLEALSRGASRAVFVDRSPAVGAAIRAALEAVQSTAGEVRRLDAGRFLDGPAEAFDVVFLDPPFRQGLVAATLARLSEGGWLAPGASVYIESEREAGPPEPPAGWIVARSATAGQVGYHLLRPPARAEQDA